MKQYNPGTFTLDNCIYDANEDFIINPNCKYVQTYSINILNSCVIIYKGACSNIKYNLGFKYMYGFIITLI